MIGLIGQKAGMTRIFTESGESVPVTVIKVNPNRVTQIKTSKIDGYKAIQVTTGERRANRITKPRAGHFAKANTESGSGLWEFRLLDSENCELKLGDELKVTLFAQGQVVDVSATSKGKGFQGGVKRHNFHMQDATHGNSVSHRAIGSTGQNQSPGRVFKGKKMPGQMGNVKVTVQNQAIIAIDEARNLLLIKGGVPGPAGGHVCIKPAVKVTGGSE